MNRGPIVRSSAKFEVKTFKTSKWEILRDARDMDTKRICTSLLVTGMKYAELQRLRENHDWLGGKFIYLSRGSMLKVNEKQRERALMLSDMGKTILRDLFQVPDPMPERPTFYMKLRRLSRRTPDDPSINNKTFGKTRESWLLFYFSDKTLQIALSQGHTITISHEHDPSIPFEEDDRKDMRKWAEGWT